MLAKAKIVYLVSFKSKTIGDLTNPDKVLLNNTKLSFILGEHPNIGRARETFYVNQLKAVSNLSLANQGDFIVDIYTFEVGGNRKAFDQIKDIPNSFVVSDDLEIGLKYKIPLWLFGLSF